MRTQRLRPRVRAEKEFRDAARKNRRVFVCASTHYSHLCNTDHIKPGWGVGESLMLKELNFVMNYVFTLETWYSFFVLRR